MNHLTLITRRGTHQLLIVSDKTIVEIAKEHRIPWGHACERGICAQCRTKVVKGAELLNDITPEEKLRLRKAERSEGYRLGCQIKVKQQGEVELVHSPY